MSEFQMSAAEAQARLNAGNQYTASRNAFKKGAILGANIHQEPTLLSWFFVFDLNSPLFNMTDINPSGVGSSEDNFKTSALHYFMNVVGAPTPESRGARYAGDLQSFSNILFKINKEMPWFWDKLTGLETARLVNPEEPFHGAEKPKIEIECLEENIELTATKLMALYRSFVWDEKRKVRILPTNLCRFNLDVYVTEVRSFQSAPESALLGSPRGSDLFKNMSNQDTATYTANSSFGAGFTQEGFDNPTPSQTKPFFRVRLYDCEFDLNSGQEIFADLSRNPEVKKPKIAITFQRAEVEETIGGLNLPLSDGSRAAFSSKYPNSGPKNNDPYNANGDGNKMKDLIKGMANDAAADVANKVNGAINKAKNLTKLTTGGGALGNVNGVRLSGAAASLAGRIGDAIGAAFLGNVHGLNPLGTLQQAIDTASINAILPTLKNLARGDKNKGGDGNSIAPGNIYDNLNINRGLAGSEISPKNIYDGINPDTLDSTPDGNLNDNVYE
jgi:hypothetical protein